MNKQQIVFIVFAAVALGLAGASMKELDDINKNNPTESQMKAHKACIAALVLISLAIVLSFVNMSNLESDVLKGLQTLCVSGASLALLITILFLGDKMMAMLLFAMIFSINSGAALTKSY
jgi:hypothetical protein